MYTKQQHKNYNFFSPQKYCETSKFFCRYQKLSQNEFMIKKEFSSRGKLKQNVFSYRVFFKWLHGVQSSTIVLAKIKRLVWFSNLSSFLQIQPNELKFASQFKRNDKQLVKQGKGEKSNNALKCKWRNESYKSMCNNNCLRQNFISVVTCRLVVRIQSAV